MKRISIILLLTLAASSMQAQRIKGSDTVLPVAQQTAERFMALNPDARIITRLLNNPNASEKRNRMISTMVMLVTKPLQANIPSTIFSKSFFINTC